MAQGIDPKYHKEQTAQAKRKEIEATFEKFASDWQELKLKTLKPDTVKKWWDSLNKHILPRLGKTPVTQIAPKQVIDILKPLEAQGKHETVKRLFPNHRKPKDHASAQTVNMAIKRMGFAGELVAHGLRALASTTLNEQGFNPGEIEAALAHSDPNKIRGTYNRAKYIEQCKIMMNWWSEHIQKAATGDMSSADGYKGLRAV